MTIRMPITKGYFVLLDDDDAWAAERKWHAAPRVGTVYAAATVSAVTPIKRRLVYLHRVIVGAPDGLVVDHINGDGLDNRKCNLRVCSHQENMRNMKTGKVGRSAYKGVYWHGQSNNWTAQIVVSYKRFTSHGHRYEIDAALAYDAMARKYFGGFARCNNPDES